MSSDPIDIRDELVWYLEGRLSELLLVPESEMGEATQAEATRLRDWIEWLEGLPDEATEQ